MSIVKKSYSIKLEKRRILPVTSGEGSFSLHDGYAMHDVEVIVDLDKLVKRLGEKAVRSKGGAAREAGGAVVVKRMGVRPHS